MFAKITFLAFNAEIHVNVQLFYSKKQRLGKYSTTRWFQPEMIPVIPTNQNEAASNFTGLFRFYKLIAGSSVRNAWCIESGGWKRSNGPQRILLESNAVLSSWNHLEGQLHHHKYTTVEPPRKLFETRMWHYKDISELLRTTADSSSHISKTCKKVNNAEKSERFPLKDFGK